MHVGIAIVIKVILILAKIASLISPVSGHQFKQETVRKESPFQLSSKLQLK